MKKHFDRWQGFIQEISDEKVYLRVKKIDSSRNTSIGEESYMEMPISSLSR